MASETMPNQPARPVPLPRTWSIGGTEMVGLLIANGVLILAMWLRHGGLDQLDTLGGQLTAIGQLTALYGTYIALIQLVLMSRSPWLDQAFGMDGLAWAHRWLGFACVWLLLGHVVFITAGYALGDGSTVVGEFITLVTTYPYVLMALVSGGLFAMVAISSMRAARHRLSYETWYGLHLYAYLAIALGFLHQVYTGNDFIHDPVAVGLLAGAVRRDRRAHPRLPGRAACLAVGAPPLARLGHHRRGARHLLDLRDRARPPQAGGPLGPVLQLAVPDP